MGKARIVSRSYAVFRDRVEAGKLLAGELLIYRDRMPVVLGIPRGGVVVAAALARALDGELDVVLAHKLGTPGQPELAMGSVTEDGKVFLNEDVTGAWRIAPAAIESEKRRQLALLKERVEVIRKVRPKVPLGGRVVIVTDDGVATGATTQAALWAARAERPESLIAAFPVGPEDTVNRLSVLVDEIICLQAPPTFAAVGQFYERFEPIEDEAMLAILADDAGGHRSARNRAGIQ